MEGINMALFIGIIVITASGWLAIDAALAYNQRLEAENRRLKKLNEELKTREAQWRHRCGGP